VHINANTITTDVLIIGSGIAGCFAAIRARECGADVIIAEQGVAGFHGRTSTGTNINRVVCPDDDFDAALKGTVLETDYMVDQEYAESAIAETWDRFRDMLAMGADFERDFKGNIKWMIMDTQYPEFKQRQAIWKPFGSYKHINKFKNRAVSLGTQVIDRITVTDLLVTDGKVSGAVGINNRSGELYIFRAKAVVIATADYHAAGCNTPSFTGDGMGMALRAGAGLRGMEFGRICFGAIWPDYDKQQLTAADRMGNTFRNMNEQHIRIVNANGEEFLEQYELLYRKPGRLYGGPSWKNYIGAVIKENKEGRGPCYYDVGKVRFEIGYTQKASAQTGGIRINPNASTDIPGLYAGGTASDMCGAMHFSIPYNLMGSSITGRRAGENAADFVKNNPLADVDTEQLNRLKTGIYAPLNRESGITEAELRVRLIEAWPYADYRTDENLRKAYEIFSTLEPELDNLTAGGDTHELVKCLKLRNVVQLAQAEVLAARERTESRIEHYRDDYPLMNNIDWLKWIIIRGTGGNMYADKETIPIERWKYRPEPAMFDRLAPRKYD